MLQTFTNKISITTPITGFTASCERAADFPSLFFMALRTARRLRSNVRNYMDVETYHGPAPSDSESLPVTLAVAVAMHGTRAAGASGLSGLSLHHDSYKFELT